MLETSGAVEHTGGRKVQSVLWAVVIHVATAHRDAAFRICRQLIERLKADLPVWKDKDYGDGSRSWLQGS